MEQKTVMVAGSCASALRVGVSRSLRPKSINQHYCVMLTERNRQIDSQHSQISVRYKMIELDKRALSHVGVQTEAW